jgi:endonuclease/exonuclease/phosphatase family metal-dependent hydrolase
MKAHLLHVLSYNIHKGFSSTNLRFVLTKIKQSIHQVHADLVFLQEVLGRHDKHDRRLKERPALSQLEYLADQVWPHTAYGKNAVYASGHHGNAILSKRPIDCVENLDVSTGRLQKRGLLHARIVFPDRKEPLHAICMHLDLFESGRRKQVEQLCRRILDAVPPEAPLIVAGDFNDWRARISAVLEERLNLREAFQCVYGDHARTFPSWLPVLRLDRIYVRGLEIRSAHVLARAPWNRLSDHAALFSELAF